MKKFTIASLLLIALPITGMAAADQTVGAPNKENINQSHPGSTMSSKEQASSKHLAAAAAHEQAAMHHKAAADALQPEQAKEHAKAAEKASLAACDKSKEAVTSSLGK